VRALKWSSIDTGARTLTIGRAIVEIEGGLFEKDTKTHAIRRIALDQQTLAVLAEHRSAAEKLASGSRGRATGHGYVFTFDPAGSVAWTPDYATKTFQQVRTTAKMPSVRLHDLRHFAATRLLAAGIPVRTVSGRLGHANAATTLGVYAHFIQASDRHAADEIASTLRRN
jgi:integrase